MKLTIKIDSDNEACHTYEDAVYMLEAITDKIRALHTHGFVRDVNGNSVGRWDLEVEDEDEYEDGTSGGYVEDAEGEEAEVDLS